MKQINQYTNLSGPLVRPAGLDLRGKYKGNTNYNQSVELVINAFFAQFKALAGKPTMISKPGKKVVLIPYYLTGNGSVLTSEKINALGLAITSILQSDQPSYFQTLRTGEVSSTKGHNSTLHQESARPIVEVRFLRLRYPYLNSTILAQYLAINAGKYNFLRMKNMLFEKAPITGGLDLSSLAPQSLAEIDSALGEGFSTTVPNQMKGIKMELAGRLTTQRSIPRKTVSNVHKGSLQSGSVTGKKAQTDFSQYTSKNKLGTYTMKVWLSQNS